MIPGKPRDHPVRDCSNDTTDRDDGPQPTQNPHVAVLVALVGLLVARSSPEQLDAKQAVFDSRQVGVRLHHHDVLHVEPILGLGPESEEQRAVEDGRNGKGQVVVLEPLRAEEQKKRARDR